MPAASVELSLALKSDSIVLPPHAAPGIPQLPAANCKPAGTTTEQPSRLELTVEKTPHKPIAPTAVLLELGTARNSVSTYVCAKAHAQR